ncbi:MAG: RluA family pseudouridine synthase [Epsilonproteobacteria bacterium]|nr:RluA family pseudouridine synthase [Campylobacterota bacterium]
MPFVKKTFHIPTPTKAFLFVMRNFNLTQAESQRFIDKGRIVINNQPLYDKKATISGDIEVIYFEPKSRGIKPIFSTKDFLIYDKPSGVLTHPNCMATEYSMLDEIRLHSGNSANATHRIDMETSGLLLASRHKQAERFIKGSFEKKTIQKYYLAWVRGKITEPFVVEKAIKIRDDYSINKHKVEINPDGKYAKTEFRPITYDSSLDASLLECKPLTGRTHQIRIHLFHVKHSILGDPIYGTSFEYATKYLDGVITEDERLKATGATRLMLHANSLDFYYNCRYYIVSKVNFYEFKKEICPPKERLF